MRVFARFDPDGQAQARMTTSDREAGVPAGFVEVDPALAQAQVIWRRGGQVIEAPPRPTEFHRHEAGAWVLDAEAAWSAVRRERDDRLARTDWVVLRAADQGGAVPPEWLAYRQALRDVTAQADPLNIAWPVAPAA